MDVARADVAREAHAEVAVDSLPLLPDAALAACGAASGSVCPVRYVGTSVIKGHSSTGFTAAMAPDDSLYLGGGFGEATDFDPSAGMDLRSPGNYANAFVTKLGPAAGYGFTATFEATQPWGAGVWGLSASTTAVVAVGGFDGTIDLDPGPGVDTHATNDSMWSRSFAVKLTPAGTFVWGRALESSGDGSAFWNRVASAADGTTTLAGSYRGVVDLDPGPGVRVPTNPGGAFFMRLDGNGNLAWVRTLGGATCHGADVTGVSLGADGTAWFTGPFQGACAFDPATAGSPAFSADNGLFVVSLAVDGKLGGLWTVNGTLQVAGIGAAPGGGVYIGGVAFPRLPGQPEVVDFDPSAARAERTLPADTSHGFVLALGATGTFRWVQLLPDLGVTAIAADAAGGVLVAGGPTTPPVGMFVLALDAEHREAWRLFAGGRTTMPSALMAGTNGFAVAGTQMTPGDLDPSSEIDRFDGTISFVSRYRF